MTRPFPKYYAMIAGELTESDAPFAKVQAPPRRGEREFANVPRKRTIKPAENSPGVQELESDNTGKENLFRKPRRRRESIAKRLERLQKAYFNAAVAAAIYPRGYKF